MPPASLRPIDPTVRWWAYRNDFDQIEEAELQLDGDRVPVSRLRRWHQWMHLCVGCIEVKGVGKHPQAVSFVQSVAAKFRQFAPAAACISPASSMSSIDRDDDTDNIVAFQYSGRGRESGVHISSSPRRPRVNNGSTALHWAAWKNHVALVEHFTSRNIEIGVTDRAGNTALHCAARRGSIQAGRILIANKIAIGTVNSYGKSALDIANERGFVEMADVIKKAIKRAAVVEATEGGEDLEEGWDVTMLEEMLEGGLGPYGGDAETVAAELGYEKVRFCTIRREPGEKLGVQLKSSKEHAGTLAGKVVPGSPADRTGVIVPGDLIVAVQRQSVFELSHTEILAIVKSAGEGVLELAVVRPVREDLDFLRFGPADEGPAFSITKSFPIPSHSAGSGEPNIMEAGAKLSVQPRATSASLVPSPSRLSTTSTEPNSPLANFTAGAAAGPAYEINNTSSADIPIIRAASPDSLEPEPITISEPDSQTSTTVKFVLEQPSPVFHAGQALRLVLPTWCCTRVLRHIRVVHLKYPDGWRTVGPVPDQHKMVDAEPVRQNVKVWGCCLLADDKASQGMGKYMVPGATVMLHSFSELELDGHLATILQIQDGGKVDVQLKKTGYRLLTSTDHLRIIYKDAGWWSFTPKLQPTEHFTDKQGVKLSFSDSEVWQHSWYNNWCGNVGVIHAGAVEVTTSGSGEHSRAIVAQVEVEFYPDFVPTSVGQNIKVEEVIKVPGLLKFSPIFSGLRGTRTPATFHPKVWMQSKKVLDDGVKLQRSFEVESVPPRSYKGHRAPPVLLGNIEPAVEGHHASMISEEGLEAWQIGSGWQPDGDLYIPVRPTPKVEGRPFVNSSGELRIPLPDGLRLLGVEIAVIALASEYSSISTASAQPMVWAKLSTFNSSDVFRHRLVETSTVISGGPPDNRFVTFVGDELVVGVEYGAVVVIGYRLTTRAIDDAELETALLKHLRDLEMQGLDSKAEKWAANVVAKKVILDRRAVVFPYHPEGSLKGAAILGIGTFGEVLKGFYYGQAMAFKPIKEHPDAKAAKDGEQIVGLSVQRLETREVIAIIAKLMSQVGGHTNVLSYFGIYDQPFEALGTDFRLFVVQEIHQGSLRAKLDAGPLEIEQQLRAMIGICDGMHHLHTRTPRPVLHGDLKAANVMLRADGTACVADFGLGALKAPATERSLGWAAPELICPSAGQPRGLTKATDVYVQIMQ